MANELWQQRVQRAQEAAAARLGVDVSVMRPPRSPSAEGSAQEGKEAAPEPTVPAVVTEAEAVVEAVEPVTQVVTKTAPRPAKVQTASAGNAAADRVAAAKARAAAKAAANSASAAPKPATSRATAAKTKAAAPAAVGQPGMNRREFVTYAWAAALGLLTLEGGLATYQFMYPRFKAGEFGGKFDIGVASAVPPTDAPPKPAPAGKYWLVNTDAGPKALYMVCTHLGCLYKWAPSNNRFECPCHGSKYTREGFYIEGPTPRSLDQFIVEVVDDGNTAVTTDSDKGAVPPPVSSPNAEIIINTGKKILGKPSSESPFRAAG